MRRYVLAVDELKRYAHASKLVSDRLVELTGDKELDHLFKDQYVALYSLICAVHDEHITEIEEDNEPHLDRRNDGQISTSKDGIFRTLIRKALYRLRVSKKL